MDPTTEPIDINANSGKPAFTAETPADLMVCPDCGKTFASAVGLGAHRRHSHGVAGPKATTVSPNSPRIRVQQPPSTAIDSHATARTDRADDRKKARDARAKMWSDQILKDLNPVLVATSTMFIGAPGEWLDLTVSDVTDLSPEDRKAFTAKKGFVGLGPVVIGDAKVLAPVWNPTLRTQLSLDEAQAKRLANAAAQFSDSPMGLALAGWFNSHQELIALGLAGITAGMYGWRLMSMKQAIGQVQTTLAQIQAAEAAAMGPMPQQAEG